MDADLGALLLCIATLFPPDVVALILAALPGIEVVRLACVHKTFRIAYESLCHNLPAPTAAGANTLVKPPAGILAALADVRRLVRAAYFEDTASFREVLVSGMLTGVDERGDPIQQAIDEATVYACCFGSLPVVKLLVEHPVCPGNVLKHKSPDTLVAPLLDAHVLQVLTHQELDEFTRDAVIYAALFGRTQVLEYLLESNVAAGGHVSDIQAYACRFGYADILELFFRRNDGIFRASQTILIFGLDQLLHSAALWGHPNVVEMLLRNGANVKTAVLSEDDCTMLMYTVLAANERWHELAPVNGHINTMRLLVQYGDDVRAVNMHGETALELAQAPEVQKVLRELGALQ